ncbi:glutamate--tRNA ligase [Candidatus Woesebacteria bacterium RBG_16_34_12]|uniref:Glutamate--tRNA ligase n=1 Tax=Candidatus Woesebacteria bacterium RBG_16_34_12 TaxID=1802480 RepID=A0A1F7XC68_9BACT|nr:MAG: glutamate--tRNA ligase [Candidatus Woesebacteria bacterium RBG_16_34_12]
MRKEIRTRFAPSPTGYLHVGSLRTALFEYAYAKTHGGQFILRIEDTDRKRFVEGATENLIAVLEKFGIKYDEGPIVGGPYSPYIQSERVKKGIYKKAAEELIKKGNAFYCFCESKSKEEIESLHNKKVVELRDPCRNLTNDEAKEKISKGQKPAVRLRVPDTGSISYYDFVLKKEVGWNLRDVDEAMLLKSDGFPTYHLAVVIDDIIMKINPVFRGFEWLPSTPIHLLLYKYLGKKIPNIGHFSLVLDPDGGKLSKRKGNVSCEALLAEGYLSEALLNFIMLLGWAPKDNREIYTLSEYIKEFKNGDLQIANAIFNRDKLNWFNGEYIRKTPNSKLQTQIFNFYKGKYDENLITEVTPLVKERMNKLSEFESLAGFFFKKLKVKKSLLGKNYKIHLKAALKSFEKIGSWDLDSINSRLSNVIGRSGFKTGDFYMDLRIALTGSRVTPPINESIVILGKEVTLKRLKEILNTKS